MIVRIKYLWDYLQKDSNSDFPYLLEWHSVYQQKIIATHSKAFKCLSDATEFFDKNDFYWNKSN
tara:strand:- start:278 stop:469 length:192 start_codon:yes stop_codon:yes gene_type:complete